MEALWLVDTLVHNFLHRTGILQRLSADHPYGAKRVISQAVVPAFSASSRPTLMRGSSTRLFRRHSRGSYRARSGGIAPGENGLDICNGNRIDDDACCDNAHCQLFRRCDRIALHPERAKIGVFHSFHCAIDNNYRLL